MRHATDRQTHLDTAQCAGQHQIVEVAEVPDTEGAAFELAEAHAERHVEALEDGLAKPVGVVRLWDDDRRHRIAVLLRVGGLDFEVPGAHRPACRFAKACMTRKHPRQPFVEEHLQHLAQTVEKVGRRGVGEESALVVADHRFPGPVRLRQTRRVCRGERLVADGVEAKARWQHQPFLRAAHGDVHAPVVVAVVDRRQ